MNAACAIGSVLPASEKSIPNAADRKAFRGWTDPNMFVKESGSRMGKQAITCQPTKMRTDHVPLNIISVFLELTANTWEVDCMICS